MSLGNFLSCFGSTHPKNPSVDTCSPQNRKNVMLSSKIPRKQPDPSFQIYEDGNDSEVAAFLNGQEPIACKCSKVDETFIFIKLTLLLLLLHVLLTRFSLLFAMESLTPLHLRDILHEKFRLNYMQLTNQKMRL